MRPWVAGPVLALVCGRATRNQDTTAPDAADALGIEQSAAQRAFELLARRGLVERRGRGHYLPTGEGVRVAREGARIVSGPTGPQKTPRKPRRDTFQARVWAALRQLRKATVPDLIQIAARGTESDPESNAARYLKALVAAGFVVQRGRVPGKLPRSNGFKQYILVRDPGPRAPVVDQRRATLRDTNSGKVHDLSTGGEARR